MGLFHKSLLPSNGSNPMLPLPAPNAKMPLRGHRPKTAQKETQFGKERRVHVRPRRSIKPRHDELVDADPVVVDIFDCLQNLWRHQHINHLIAAERRASVMQRHRDRERRAWTRLLDYLNNRFERMD
jgi:hypothetical protein